MKTKRLTNSNIEAAVKRERLKNCLVTGLFLVVSVFLVLVFLLFARAAFNCFSDALRMKELCPWLISITEPGAEGALHTLEEEQFKWVLAGIFFAVPALLAFLALAGIIGIRIIYPWYRRKMRRTTQVIRPTYTDKYLQDVAKLLCMGCLVAVPTETVYGLAADATQAQAVQANYDAKGRPETKPLNVLVDGMDMVERICRDIPTDAYKLAEAFWPGPLTIILWGNGVLPPIVPAGGATQGVRCPAHPATLAVIRALGRPLACPSANLSGQPSPKSAAEVLAQLNGRIQAVLDGGPCLVGVESTILDLTVAPYRILRQGGLSRENIEAVLGREVEA